MFDVYKYPFDKQACHLSFIVWPYLAREVNIVVTDKEVKLPFFQKNGVWDLLGTATKVYVGNELSVAYFQLEFQRLSNYFILNVIMPIILLCVLDCLVFMIPLDSGERVSFSVTVLLSFAVFMTLVNDNIPRTSAPMSLLCYYAFFSYAGSVLVMIVVTVNSRIFHRDPQKPVPLLYRKLATCCCFKHETIIDSETNEHVRRKIQIQWRDVAICFDHFCLLFFVLYFSGLTTGMFFFVYN